MTNHDHRQQTPSKLGRLNAILSVLLVTLVAAFVLIFAVKVGYDLVAALEPAQADAAPEVTATVTTEAVATATATTVPPTPTTAPPSPTPQPTATPEPTATPLPPTPVPPRPRIVANETDVNVRRGPSTDYEKLGVLEQGSEISVTGRYEDWWRVSYEGQTAYVFGDIVTASEIEDVPTVPVTALPGPTIGYPLFEPADPSTINEDRWINVDLSEQRVTAYEGQTPVKTYLVSTGLPATPTPEGQFRIWVKFRYDDMEGEDYFLEDVPHVMYFHQGYGFHGVWWHANWGHRMSHGCINQPNDMAEWLFNFAEVGTLVNVHE